ncbi:MAG: hypothetical protein JRE16_11085 [Deltaproteobacteria bacterium]|jgi:phage shock protein PspC (stress-responsive transcriptional regulator)|nr:hypothetical protein [Deltaproteobacteria bacterium]
MNSRRSLTSTRIKAILLSVLFGTLAAFGAAFAMAIVYAVAAIGLAGHNQTFLGWNGTYHAGFDWTNFVFAFGTLFVGFGTALLVYRAMLRRMNPNHDR